MVAIEAQLVEYDVTPKGIMVDFLHSDTILYIQGEVKEVATPVINNHPLKIDVMTIPDEFTQDIYFDDDENIMWQMGETLDDVHAMYEEICEGDDNSPYIWCSALIKTQGKYLIVTFDFFDGDMVVREN